MATPSDLGGAESPATAERVVFDYVAKPRVLILAASLFAGGGWFMWDHADTNLRGLDINHLIELGPKNATRFYYGVAVACFALVAMAVVFGLPQLLIRRRVVLADDSITLPRWWFSREHYTIPVAEITGLTVTRYRRTVFLKVRTAQRNFSVNSSLLPKDEDADIIIDWFAARGLI